MVTYLIFSMSLLLFMLISNFKKNYVYNLEMRERRYEDMPVYNIPKAINNNNVKFSRLIVGSAVFTLDFGRRFHAYLDYVSGGKLRYYEELIEVGRREAIQKIKEQAIGYNYITNIKFSTNNIGKPSHRKYSQGIIEVVATGTAIKTYDENEDYRTFNEEYLTEDELFIAKAKEFIYKEKNQYLARKGINTYPKHSKKLKKNEVKIIF